MRIILCLLSLATFATNALSQASSPPVFRDRYGYPGAFPLAPRPAQARPPASSQPRPFQPQNIPTNEEFVARLELDNGVIYTNARIKYANLSQVFVLTEAGGARVQSELLPEPYRTKYYDAEKLGRIVAEQAAAKLKSDQARAERDKQNEWAQRKQFVQQRHPLRVINGELFDFTYPLQAGPGGCGIWNIKGKVLQVLDSGLLVDREDRDQPIFLKNYPREESMIDGYSLRAVATPVGRYQYLNTAGAQHTVMSYDCGRPYDPESDKFSEKTKVYCDSTKESRPVTDLDKFPLLEKATPPAPKKPGLKKLGV